MTETRIASGATYVIPANPRRERLSISTRSNEIEVAAEGLPGSAFIVGEIVFGDGTPVPIGRVVLRNARVSGQRALVRIEETVSVRRAGRSPAAASPRSRG